MEDILALRTKLAGLDAERHEIEGRIREMRPPRGPFDKAGRGPNATRDRGSGRGTGLNRPWTRDRDRGREMQPDDGASSFYGRRRDSSRNDEDRGVEDDRDDSSRLKRRRETIKDEDEHNDDAEENVRHRARPKVMSAIVATGSQARVKSSATLAEDFTGPRNDRTYGPGGSTFRKFVEEELVVATPEPQAAYKAVETVTRNKRMFGALMGHLGSAQRRLKKDEDVIKKQEQMQHIASQKSQEEAARLRELQRRLNQEKREREMQSRDEIVAKRKALEVNLLQVAFKAQKEPLLKFLVTVTQPPLCYVPAQHNDATLAKLNAQKADIEARIKEREENDTERLRVIDLIVPEGIERRRIRREAARLRKVGAGVEAGAGEEDPDDGDQDEDGDEGEGEDPNGDGDQDGDQDQIGEQDGDGDREANGVGELNPGDVGIDEGQLDENGLHEAAKVTEDEG